MPYISTETVKAIRQELKRALPQFKMSVTKEHSMAVHVSFLSGPIPLSTVAYEQVNEYRPETVPSDERDEYGRHIRQERCGAALAILQKAIDIANSHQGRSHYDSDYGNIPTYYTHINVGRWDRSYWVQDKKVSMSVK